MNAPWCSYDPIAEAYQRVAERRCFAKPARELVDLLAPAPGTRLLDVGAGTGVVSALAAKIVGSTGLVAGFDPSVGMLRILRKRCEAAVVAGALPNLPFPDGVFDAIAAAFVLTHVQDGTAAVAAMTRVLRPGGRLGVSSWAQSEASTPPGRTWQSVARRYLSDGELQAAIRAALPLQDSFGTPAFLQAALTRAGLADVSIREIPYSIQMTVPEFAELRQISASGRFLRETLPPSEWARFNEEALGALAEAYGGTVSFPMRANVAAGQKPADPSRARKGADVR